MQVIIDRKLNSRVIISNVKAFRVNGNHVVFKSAKNADLKAYIDLLKIERYNWTIIDEDEYDATIAVHLMGITVNVY